MSAPDPTGEAIATHWVLVAAIVAGVVSFGVLVRFMLVMLIDGRTKLHAEINEAISISLSNGLGEKIEACTKAGVVAALAEHQVSCPWQGRVGDHHDRLVELERILLQRTKDEGPKPWGTD